MNDVLRDRASKRASRIAVRRWEYRQRNHAHGVWFRLRRALAFAAHAYAVSDEEMDHLLAEGATLEPAGNDLEPRKRIVVVSSERAAAMPGARRLPVKLSPELLAASNLVLVAFP